MSLSSQQPAENQPFDFKSSQLYWNSTAALMESQFKNMKNEDFVYPAKKKVGMDDGAIIRGEEHLRRQQESAKYNNLLTRDPYLDYILSTMTDEDFTYETKKPVDPNYGRVVRAFELMEIAGGSSDKPTAETKKETSEPTQNDNVIPSENNETAPEKVRTQENQKNSNQGYRGGRGNGNGYKQNNYKGRNKNETAPFSPGHRANINENGSRRSSYNSPRHQKYSDVVQLPQDLQPATHFYENQCFTPQNGNFIDYTNNGTTYQPSNDDAAIFNSGNVNNATFSENGQNFGGFRGRGNRNGGYNGNRGGRRRSNNNWNNSNRGNNGFWTGEYKNNQTSWKTDQ
ncbi:Caprin-1_dimer domain-containing protein [Caenorhabditis elegans]|uniref:Caprin-1_dimer domain-containing protein n=1 Tax=Caenorhabditis elegans TaxID=6239 RepID=O02040_CAEEL|nr:Caprin-1_dimer domain-containing protein [Caenorhabditis elegans]CCD61705.1 Caprin-1_dimer domain-containing protein [Caenorhabditis elegans]|eukprot:NP_510777.1 Uncharacterized protein CELE_T23C6.4 [Caenorhabditis elegans]